MGFSLRRALAGAVAGGAGAAVELADNAIKAAEHDRQKAQEFERQKELLALHDSNAANREQRSYEFKEKREADRAARFGTFLSKTAADLKKEGIDSASAEGQARIAQSLLENGYPAEGNKYQENYINLTKIKSDAELKKAEQAIRLEMARDRRSGTVDKDSAKAAEKRLGETIDSFSFATKERDGKKGEPDERAVDEIRKIVDRERRAGTSAEDINSALIRLKPAFNAERDKNPSATGDVLFRSAWAQVNPPKQKEQAAPPATTTAAPEPEKKRIPGAPEQLLGGASSTPASTHQFQTSSNQAPPPPPQRSAAGIPMSAAPVTGTKPMSRTVVDDINDGLGVLTGGGNTASWNQVGGDIGKPRSAR